MRTLQDLLQIMVGPQVPRSLPHGRAREATEQHYVRPVAVCVRFIVGVRTCTHSSFALRCGAGKDCLKGPSGGPCFTPGQTQPLHSINYGSARAHSIVILRTCTLVSACFGLHLGTGLEEEEEEEEEEGLGEALSALGFIFAFRASGVVGFRC